VVRLVACSAGRRDLGRGVVIACRKQLPGCGTKEPTNMQQRRGIAKDEGVMLGKPTVAGTRLTVELILEKLAAGEGVGRIVGSYPRLDRESVREALLFAAKRVEEVLARLRLANKPLVDAVVALDDHSEEDEKIEAPPRRHFPDEAEPPALLAVAEKVLAADVSEERAIQAMRELKGSDVPRLLEAVAEAARTKEAGLEWRRPSRDAWPESVVALAFASEVLRIFR
jgi:uncharacterized protein (DUF433 family)